MEDDFDDLAYHRDHVSALIAGGFFNEDDLETYIADMAFDPDAAPYAAAVRDHARAAMVAKRAAEAGWPAETDCDRLDRAFAALEADGILALHNAGVTTSDAHGDAWDTIGRSPPGRWRGFAFYHGQDVDRAVGGGGLFIGFDAVAEGAPAKQAIGDAITAALAAERLAANWNRDPETRIEVPGIVWQRRTRWTRPAPSPQAGSSGNGLWRRLFG
ncbi:DUF6891 domain-containing protein [Erythrobacter sp. BLCC-B19]|uniref:DUF6891 domain-containing protein n=1 Tax=Erythrobacter sp. BLCC-B19 TaxID=3025315 RepID=UPI00235FE870|nr:hypothetical protein [Erythrobacter sp. BLCC-B19]WDA41767.1 hypothetical protein PS060_02885 [Erythrobacter sp. BLCC-B19]